MKISEAKIVKTVSRVDAIIAVPPSKSYTNRALIAASLAAGKSVIRDPSKSEDTRYLIKALREFGIQIKEGPDFLEIEGSDGILNAPPNEIYVGNAGTAMRFLTSLSALAKGTTRIAGSERMNKRPMRDLLDALTSMGIRHDSANGYPPLLVHGGKMSGGFIKINCEKSSQFLSSLLLVAPYVQTPVKFQIIGNIASSPYIEMTIRTMEAFGAEVVRSSDGLFLIGNEKRYRGADYRIEGDASSATYFCAAAAITCGSVRISNLGPDSIQGDLKFIDILAAMGCEVIKHNDSFEVRGNPLQGTDIDMKDIPDSVPALAITAAFASGTTVIKNIRNLRYKESDRVAAIAEGLKKIGCCVYTGGDWMKIVPGKLQGAVIETYNDHRIAMSFAVAGLKIKGIKIKNPESVVKSYPDFWEEISKIGGR